MNTWLRNISVTRKLGLGFGVVLLLTSALALVGWMGLNSLTQRSHWMSDITHLNNTLTGLRITRLQYMLANGDDKVGDTAQAAFENFMRQQQETQKVFRNPENVRLLKAQGEVTEEYLRSFALMREGYRAGQRALAGMAESASLSGDTLARIRGAVRALPEYESQRSGQLQVIAEAVEGFLLLRYQVQAYVNAPSAEQERAVASQIESTSRVFASLRERLGADHDQELNVLGEAFGRYTDAIAGYSKAVSEVALARVDLTKQGQDIVKYSDELYRFQLDAGVAEASRAHALQLLTALLALVFGVLAAWFITRQITRPLSDTLQEVERVASGDLSRIVQVNRRDELGVLQQGVQHMRATLHELISGIRGSVIQIASAAEELSAVTGQTSAGANTQKVETDQVATAMHEMSATVNEVARNAEQASLAASQADEQAQAGDRVVAEAIGQIERLAQEVERSTEAMASLQEESNKIGSVMDVIKTVAEQTNLLALNAAIEAARAGEAGRGFAVVADEVRGLAQRTQKSTEEIEALIAGLQQGTRQVAGIMNGSRELTGSSVALARKAGESLSSITRTVSSIQSMNQQIATAAEEQSSVAEEISRSVVNVRDVSEQTAAANEETAASSVELARLGNELQTMVSHFKV
ncbi:methyl-accepting chemotaxis protein [Stutzerimonas kirkiae]|uniref:methyl-accepting chemotaxis protein n=1 Tax=Stutzerimonas kirkiae TaxID=2211392 RepID=UPI0010384C80|nr:methyl-accepting chemotaxis protein [Stutzerimonas kirkiae]TBV14689.1 methyl-accepting chemotaxis protein [Stutzerimonas kirkiae]